MSVRRLADENVQPAAFRFSPENAAWAQATIRKYPEGRQQSAVIPLMMRAQEQDGWVTKAAIEGIADMLGMPYIRALEVATFYTQFQLKPVGARAHVQVCGTTPCMLRGSEALMEVCRSRIHHDQFETNASGTLSWEEVECQGTCVNAPMVMIFKDTYEDLTPERLEEIIDAFEAGKGAEVPPGPQIDRIYSAPVGGLTSLTEESLFGDNGGKRKTASAAQVKAGEAIPPSKAAKPSTDALETDAAIVSPSPKKVSGKDETQSTGNGPARRTGTGGSSSGNAANDKGKPQGTPRPGQPDDLKLISGIGPKIEGKLNDLGIWKYDQIASWKTAECDWIDDYLSFHGRIERDDWVRQAEALAKGGEAEYIKVFGKKPR